MRSETEPLAFWFLANIPGTLGEWIRSIALRRFLKHLGKNTVFQLGIRITSADQVSVGSNCNFAQGVFIAGGGGVLIGDWVGFGPDAKVWSVNHRFDDPDRPWQLQGWTKKPVVIEDDVWLAANVFVMPGVTIGKGAIISAGTVVNKSIPAYAVVSGNPGRVVGWRKRPNEMLKNADTSPSMENFISARESTP
jgi:maltose O-acetyltransferase